MSDMTRSEAERNAWYEQHAASQKAWKSRIIGSANEMDIVVRESKYRLQIMEYLALLTDSGLELANPHQSPVLPEQVRELVIDLAKLVENAIEEYIDG